MRLSFVCVALLCLASTAAPVLGQAPPPPPPPSAVSGNVSAGLSLTAGNKDTTNLNVGYEFKYDPKTKNVVKSSALALFGKTDGDATAEQYTFTGRDEYALNARLFVFGEVRYFHDKFKAISYLVSPDGGVGLKLVDTAPTKMSISAGVGGVWEKDYGHDLQTSGAVTFDEKLSHQLSKTASIGQTFSALWKTSDVSDSLYTFGAKVVADLVTKAQLKIEFLDTYKNQPSNPTLSKNDIALVMGLVFTF